jgi:hypothetical protein
VDLNGDGYGDILSGSYSRMDVSMAGLFQVLWGRPDGTFAKAAELTGTDGNALIIPIDSQDGQIENICTRPFAVDWDGDGDLDLVVGNFAGSFYLFPGEGQGQFLPDPKPLLSDGVPLKITGMHSDPFVIDWDLDGDLDLLSGSSAGGVQWAENIAGAGAVPELRAFRPIIEPGPPIAQGQRLGESDLSGPAGSTRVWADDVNGDGRLDLLVGDMVMLVAPVAGLSEEEFQAKSKAWQESLDELTAKFNSAPADDEEQQATIKRLQELYAQRAEFVREERTGFVWLYLQK